MSGIFIPGISMPDNCMECPFKIDGDDGGICPYVSNYCADYERDRYKDCPLVPVPDNCLGDECDWDSIFHIDHAPTIIPADPAEEGEG